MPTPTATPDPNATPTPLPRYLAPHLLSPPDGAVFGGAEATVYLQWTSVGFLRPGEWYEVHLARPGGEPVVERTKATGFRVPAEQYPPDGSIVRRFLWQVRVVRMEPGGDTYEMASAQGAVRMFEWLEQLPTPSPEPSPTP